MMEKWTKDSIIQLFNKNAKEYDSQRKKLIPCFDDFYSIAVSLVDTFPIKPSMSILDIGSGTGLLSALLVNKYPNCNLTLIDLSEKMMTIAKKRLQKHMNINYIIGDYTSYQFDTKYDIIVSSLSIHHLTHAEKRNLYHRIYSLLNENGIFINADQVLGHTPFIEKLYTEDWKNKVENSDLSKEEIASAYERTKLDKMSTLTDQLNWLAESGFQDVDCIYKYYNFVVLYGRKSVEK